MPPTTRLAATTTSALSGRPMTALGPGLAYSMSFPFTPIASFASLVIDRSPVRCERSQDSPAARARWRADAADDGGFGGDWMEADLGQSRHAPRPLPELSRCRVLPPDAEAVAGPVLRDPPPSADSLRGERCHLLAP